MGGSEKATEMRKINLIIITIMIFQMIFTANLFADDAFIRKTVITNQNDEIVLYFNLDGAFTRDIVEAIENGIPTTFTFVIKFEKKSKMSLLWKQDAF